jgi:hypothetical protein
MELECNGRGGCPLETNYIILPKTWKRNLVKHVFYSNLRLKSLGKTYICVSYPKFQIKNFFGEFKDDNASIIIILKILLSIKIKAKELWASLVQGVYSLEFQGAICLFLIMLYVPCCTCLI